MSEPEVDSRKPSKARQSISHSFANAAQQEISNLMSAQEVEKPVMKVVIATGNDTYIFYCYNNLIFLGEHWYASTD